MDKPTTVTAAVLVIGDEILSGRTKDRNFGYIAEYLTKIGVDVKEARVVRHWRCEPKPRAICACTVPPCRPHRCSARWRPAGSLR